MHDKRFTVVTDNNHEHTYPLLLYVALAHLFLFGLLLVVCEQLTKVQIEMSVQGRFTEANIPTTAKLDATGFRLVAAYDFDVIYRPGSNNIDGFTLSGIHDNPVRVTHNNLKFKNVLVL